MTMVKKPAPFSQDEDAVKERESCDYNLRFTLSSAKSGVLQRKVRVYVDGIFDFFHMGHADFLKQAKTLFGDVYLIAGVCNDRLTHSKKGITVLHDYERYELVRQCRYVDEVVKDAPWKLSWEFIDHHKIDFVAHDDVSYPTDGGENDCYGFLKERNMFIATGRIEGTSTTELISRFIKNINCFIERNLQRGVSPEELNVQTPFRQ